MALLLGGCSKQQNSSPTQTASSPATRPTPKPSPTPAGDLVIANENLRLATREFHNRNNRGALEYIDIAYKELTATAAKATDKSKTKLDAAVKDLDTVKTMIGQNDPKTDKALTKLMDNLSKLAEGQ